jgi:uncharacterized membrane protein YkvA (DUF1232 family)
MVSIVERLKVWARDVKRDITAVYLAARDQRVPWRLKIFALAIAAYALSPIDLIPDFIPVVGYLDDLILVPIALWALVRAIDPEVMAELRLEAEALERRPSSRWGAFVVILIWVAGLVAISWVFWPVRPS